MKRFYTSISILFFLSFNFSSSAQIADGTFMPNFEGVDIKGETQNLYDILAQGYKVVIDVSATWCGPCWSYHESGALEELHEKYGPNGTKEVYVLFIEGDDGTTNDDLIGIGSATYGDWTAGTPYPIIDDAGYIASLLEVQYYPTIYTVCSDGRIYESGTLTTEQHHSYAMELDCQANPVDVAVSSGEVLGFCEAPFSVGVDLVNPGSEVLENAVITMNGCDACPISQTWSGSIKYFQSEKVMFDNVEAIDSDVNLEFSIESMDANLTNNVAAQDVKISSVESSTNWTVEVHTDCYPSENSWKIYDEFGDVVAKSRLYGTPDSTYTELVSLPSQGCYNFKFFDSYGDGLNGSAYDGCEVDGSVSCYSDVGTIVEIDGVTEFSTVLEISYANLSSSTDDLLDSEIVIAPNPVSDILNVSIDDLQSSKVLLQVSDIAGKQVYFKNYDTVSNGLNDQISVANLESGIYLLSVITEHQQITKKIIVE